MKSRFRNPVLIFGLFAALSSCNKQEEPMVEQEFLQEELIKRGAYLTTVAGCNDCHSPKVMTPHGPEPDPTRVLSGHPQGEAIPPIIKNQRLDIVQSGPHRFCWSVGSVVCSQLNTR